VRIEDCKHNVTWDYLGWGDLGYNDYLQSGWNRTLITKINIISQQIHRSSIRRGADTVIMNPKNLVLFNSSYDQETQSLRNRYKIVLNEDISLNHIFVCNRTQNTNPQMVVRPVEVAEGEMPEIMVLHERQCTPEEVLEYKRNLCGYIEIQNYNEGIEPVKNIKKFKL
jgi:hypothetical protein